MMDEESLKKLLAEIEKKMHQEDVPKKPTGRLIINLQSGGVSREVTLEIKV